MTDQCKFSPSAFLVLLLFFGVVTEVHSASPPTVSEIISGIKQSQSLLLNADAFMVRCQRVKSEVITPSRYGGGYLNVEFLVAHRDDEWLVHKHFLNNDVPPPTTKLYLPPKPLTIAAKDGLTFKWQQSSPTANVSKFYNGSDIFQCLDYFMFLGVNLAKPITLSNHGDYEKLRSVPSLEDSLDHPFIPEYLESNISKYHVLPSTESVDGISCWVIEYPDMDKIWTDPARGFAILRRVYHWAPGKPRKFEIHSQNFREVIPKLWFPSDLIVDKYASIVSEEQSIWDKVTSRMHYHVDEAMVGQVPDNAFKVDIPEGLLIYDDARGVDYRVPAKGVDPLRGPDTQQLKALQNRLQSGRGWRIAMIIANALLVLVLILIILWRRRVHTKANALLLPFVITTGAALVGLTSSSRLCAEDLQLDTQKSTANTFELFPQDSSPHKKEHEDELFCWKPPWRQKGDCGPCALYILMGLEGRSVKFVDVKDSIAVDPEKGCSLNSIEQGGITECCVL